MKNASDMLQFITTASDKNSTAKEVQAALEGGCRWIQISENVLNRDDSEEILKEIIPMCQEAEAILTIENNIELADKFKIHGVHITTGINDAIKARENLGADAIIGVNISTADEALELTGKDIDYVTATSTPDKLDLNYFSDLVKSVRETGFGIHIVATGDITPEMVIPLMATGVSGIAIGTRIAESADPEETTRQYLKLLKPE